jgi:hypothetical protein
MLYHTEKEAEFKDTWTEKKNNDEREYKYGEQLKELERRKRNWRNENPDKCGTRAGGPDLGDIDELRFFAGYSPDFRPSLKEAVSLYKFLKEYQTEHGAELKESLPQKPEVLLVKEEYANEYKALCDKWMEELGIPMVTEKVGTITRTKYTINQLRNKNMKAVSASDNGLEEYTKGLISYITSSDKVEYKKKREECFNVIDKDFIVSFDATKTFKADRLSNNDLVIYSKADFSNDKSDGSSKKIITLSRENPSDDYKYLFSINTDEETLRYAKKIGTKADLRKALTNSVMMIEDIAEFKQYVNDLNEVIDSLNG